VSFIAQFHCKSRMQNGRVPVGGIDEDQC